MNLDRLKSFQKYFRPKLVLITLFVIFLGFEMYILYYKVYTNLSVSIEEAPTNSNNIVRLDLTNYKKTLDLLDSLKAYVGVEVSEHNPFK
jgi:hypothetical protein